MKPAEQIGKLQVDLARARSVSKTKELN